MDLLRGVVVGHPRSRQPGSGWRPPTVDRAVLRGIAADGDDLVAAGRRAARSRRTASGPRGRSPGPCRGHRRRSRAMVDDAGRGRVDERDARRSSRRRRAAGRSISTPGSGRRRWPPRRRRASRRCRGRRATTDRPARRRRAAPRSRPRRRRGARRGVDASAAGFVDRSAGGRDQGGPVPAAARSATPGRSVRARASTPVAVSSADQPRLGPAASDGARRPRSRAGRRRVVDRRELDRRRAPRRRRRRPIEPSGRRSPAGRRRSRRELVGRSVDGERRRTRGRDDADERPASGGHTVRISAPVATWSRSPARSPATIVLRRVRRRRPGPAPRGRSCR